MRSKIFLLTFCLILFFGCATRRLVSDYNTSSVPRGANLAKIYSKISPDSLYNIVINQLTLEGYGIKHSDSKLLSISTDSKHLGESLHLKMRIKINNNNNSIIFINGDCRKGPVSSALLGVEQQASQWVEAKWGSPMLINRTGFAGIINFANKLPHIKIEYIVR